MIRLFHAADIHFGVPYDQFNASDRAFLRLEKRRAFALMIAHAIEKKVDFLCLSGDLFDINAADPSTKIFLQEHLDKLHEASISCYCIQGNHDAERVNSLHHIKILSDQMERMEEDRFRVLGASYSKPSDARDITPHIPAVDNTKKNILLFHGMLGGSGPLSYHRLDPDDPALQTMDYIALGHVHTPALSKGKAQYPGSFFPQTKKEAGERGYLDVTIGDELVIQFHPSTDVQMVHKVIELYSTEDDFSVHHYQRLRSELPNERHLYFVRLVGHVELSEYQQVNELLQRLQEDYEREIHVENDLQLKKDFSEHPLLQGLLENLEQGLLLQLGNTALLEMVTEQMKEDIKNNPTVYEKLLLESFMEDTPWR